MWIVAAGGATVVVAAASTLTLWWGSGRTAEATTGMRVNLETLAEHRKCASTRVHSKKHTRCQWKFQCVKWEIINREKKKKKHEIKKTTTTTGGNVKLKLKSIQTWIVLCAWVWDLDSGIIFFLFFFLPQPKKSETCLWKIYVADYTIHFVSFSIYLVRHEYGNMSVLIHMICFFFFWICKSRLKALTASIDIHFFLFLVTH